MPADDPGHRPEDGVGADDSDRHIVVPRPRPPGLVLRHRPEEPQVRDLDSVGGGVEAGKQEAEEPAHILMQLADEEREQVRRVLPRVQRPRDVPRRGAEGGREEEAEGDLRGHAGQGPLRGLAPQKWKRAAAPMGWRQHGENLGRSTEKTVDKTIGTPPVQEAAGAPAFFPYAFAIESSVNWRLDARCSSFSANTVSSMRMRGLLDGAAHALVRIGGYAGDPFNTSLAQRAQKRRPSGIGLRVDGIESEQAPVAV